MGRTSFCLVLLLGGLTACDCGGEDDTGPRDAGPRDTGGELDAGAIEDAPPAADAGPADAGPPDAGLLDAGTPLADSGTDSGPPPPTDAGTQPDTGSMRECPGADRPILRANFTACPDGVHVGQTMPAPGATCEQVCCVFGFAGCVHRAAQADFEACTPEMPPMSGSCADVFAPLWSSQRSCR